jgi:hypothetical protein
MDWRFIAGTGAQGCAGEVSGEVYSRIFCLRWGSKACEEEGIGEES